MAEESAVSAEQGTPAKRRGPKSAAEIRAEVEAEMRAEMEAEIRAEMQAKFEKDRAEEEFTRQALSSQPVSGFQISGKPDVEGAVTIHFVEDGFTVLGKVWYRGEELTIEPNTAQWKESPVYRGKIFAQLDEFEQEEIWGRRIFRLGPWRGKRLTEISDPELTEADRAALARAEQIRLERFGSVLPTR